MTDDERQAELDALAKSIEVLKAENDAAAAAIKVAMHEQNEIARQMREIRGEAVWSALSDIVSGQIAQRQMERQVPWPTQPPPGFAIPEKRGGAPKLTPLDQVKPLKGKPKATVTPRRIGYTVHRTGLFIPERDMSWHLTRKGADRAVRRWVEG